MTEADGVGSLPTSSWRALSDRERFVLDLILEREFPGAVALRVQCDHCLVRNVPGRRQALDIEADSQYRANLDDIHTRIPGFAQYNDSDGMPVIVDLQVADGLLFALDVYRIDGDEPSIGFTGAGYFDVQYPELDGPRPLYWPKIHEDEPGPEGGGGPSPDPGDQ